MSRSCAFDLTLDPAAPRTARRMLCEVLPQWGIDDPSVLHDVALVVSELVTNALVHGAAGRPAAGATVTVGAEVGAELVLWVADPFPGVPAQRQPEVDAEGGRGLEILSRIALRWGVEPDAPGKRVVAALPVTQGRCA